jgi:ribonucleoside-diphosphate reductase alpha chain
VNAALYREWKDTDLIQVMVYLLDAVISEFIEKATGVKGLEKAVRSATAGRAIGVGVLGWHTLLQKEGIPFSKQGELNKLFFSELQAKAHLASVNLAKHNPNPTEWCQMEGKTRRNNTHLIAIAPTVTNSVIMGNVSPSIQPEYANVYTGKGSKGNFLRKNKVLEPILESLGQNTNFIWDSIAKHEGSVQHLNIPDGLKELFLTFFEIDQNKVIDFAAQRQPNVCQSQSVNLALAPEISGNELAKLHLSAWKQGLNSLYYVYSQRPKY